MLKAKALLLKGVGPLYLFPLSLLLSNIFISNTLNRRRVCMYYLIKYKRLREREGQVGPNRELCSLAYPHQLHRHM